MNSHKKRKFNTKKGISLVVAIALSAVLVLTTTAFISLALLQQKETGSELNTRQAYVSAKSALDMAKDMIEKGEINLAGSGPFYYVFYYDGTGVGIQTCSSIDDVNTFMENTTYTIVGNSYIKITKNGTNCTVSAFSSEGKYTADPDNSSHGDLSMKFEATEVVPGNGKATVLKINKGTVNTTPPPNPVPGGDQFLLVGSQTNFSLLKGAHKTFYGHDESFKTLKQYHRNGDHNNFENAILHVPYLNTDSHPITTQFPIVYTETVKLDSEGKRCTYKVYDQGIYYLGKYSGVEVKNANYPNDVADVCYFTNNNFYGSEVYCKFLVLNNNMVSKEPSNGHTTALKVNYYGESTNVDTTGVVVYVPKNIYVRTYSDNGVLNENKNFSYSEGYYWLPNGSDLFSTEMKVINSEHHAYSTTLPTIKNEIIYDELVDSKKNAKQLHAAWESVSLNGFPVSILNDNGTFQSGDDSNTFSTSARTEKPHDAWDNYSIYCGPSSMPSKTGYYDMFCGDTFNYLWYNTFSMDVNDNIKMSIRSNNAVLTIGGNSDYNESVYMTHTSHDIVKNYIKDDVVPTEYKNGPLKASNVIIGKTNAEFNIKPYWNGSTYTLTVMNDFFVDYPGYVKSTDPNDKGYLVKAGVYDDLQTIKDTSGNYIFANGINLFSKEAENYFSSKNSSTISVVKSDDASIGWVSGNTIAPISKTSPLLTQNGRYVNFEASSGNLVSAATYSADAIDCNFSHTVETNGATLSAKLLSINTSAIKGNSLSIDTKNGSGSASNKSHCTVKIAGVENKYDQGHLLELKQDMKLLDDSGKEWMKLKKGFYFFKTSNTKVDILSKSTWTTSGMQIFYADKANQEVTGYEFGNEDTVIEVKFEQGGYY